MMRREVPLRYFLNLVLLCARRGLLHGSAAVFSDDKAADTAFVHLSPGAAFVNLSRRQHRRRSNVPGQQLVAERRSVNAALTKLSSVDAMAENGWTLILGNVTSPPLRGFAGSALAVLRGSGEFALELRDPRKTCGHVKVFLNNKELLPFSREKVERPVSLATVNSTVVDGEEMSTKIFAKYGHCDRLEVRSEGEGAIVNMYSLEFRPKDPREGASQLTPCNNTFGAAVPAERIRQASLLHETSKLDSLTALATASAASPNASFASANPVPVRFVAPAAPVEAASPVSLGPESNASVEGVGRRVHGGSSVKHVALRPDVQKALPALEPTPSPVELDDIDKRVRRALVVMFQAVGSLLDPFRSVPIPSGIFTAVHAGTFAMVLVVFLCKFFFGEASVAYALKTGGKERRAQKVRSRGVRRFWSRSS